MNTKHLIALATFAALASAGSAAMADDITIVNEHFVSQRSRADATAEVLGARAAGVTQFVTDGQAGAADVAAPAVRSTLTRDQVRAELRNVPKARVVTFNPLA